jgi:lysine-N-methylase
MIIRLGEDALCAVCREHPRFYNLLSARYEMGIGLCCEEAVKVALYAESDEMVEVGEDDEPSVLTDDIEKSVLLNRAKVFEILAENDDLGEKIEAIEKLFSVPEKAKKVIDMLPVYCEMEELEEGFHDLIKTIETDGEIKSGYDVMLTRLLKYFVYRHATLAESEYDFAVRLGFCTLSVRMVDALSRGKNETEFMEMVRRYCAEIEYSEDNVVALLEEIAW